MICDRNREVARLQANLLTGKRSAMCFLLFVGFFKTQEVVDLSQNSFHDFKQQQSCQRRTPGSHNRSLTGVALFTFIFYDGHSARLRPESLRPRQRVVASASVGHTVEFEHEHKRLSVDRQALLCLKTRRMGDATRSRWNFTPQWNTEYQTSCILACLVKQSGAAEIKNGRTGPFVCTAS